MLIMDAGKVNKDVILTRTGCIWFLWLNIAYSLYLCLRYFFYDDLVPSLPPIFILSLLLMLFSCWNLLLTSQLIKQQLYLTRAVLMLCAVIYGVIWALILHQLYRATHDIEWVMVISLLVLFPAVIAFHLSLNVIAAFVLPIILTLFINIAVLNPLNVLFHLVAYTLALGVVLSCRNVMMEWVRKAEASEQQNARLIQKLTRLVDHDPLTGLANKRYLREYFHARTAQIAAESQVYLIMIDVDHFKRYNDVYGHLKGDECLVKVARCISDSVRNESDLAVRFGGEEFAVLLLNATPEIASQVCERIKTTLEKRAIPHESSDTAEWVTLSQGAARWQPGMSLDSLITAADQQLYWSKNHGRNQFSFYSS